MKIAIVWKNDYPWDIRIEKISKSLSVFGHDVHIIARNIKRDNIEEIIDGIKIHRLSPLKWKLNSVLSIPFFVNPLWLLKIYNVCKKEHIDLIIVRDLPLLIAGIIVARILHLPIIFDMAENYPALWAEVFVTQKNKLSNFLLKNYFLGKILEKYGAKNADHIFTVVEEAKNYLVASGIGERKISIVSNTPDLKKFEKLDNTMGSFKQEEDIILLYQGYVNAARGLGLVIESMPHLIKKHNKISLVIIGDGDDLVTLKERCKILKIEDKVIFKGWVASKDIPMWIRKSHIGIVPHPATTHKNTTIPNKIFDYMAYKKPIIVSDAIPLKRIVKEENCGVFFESYNVESFISAVEQLINNPKLLEEYGKNGRDAVIRRYNWQNDSGILKRVVKSFDISES
jgi:glycosyltransferase involved in cell wall biosynthesis